MALITLATWNINSVRLRLPLLKHLTEELHPDILCLQETKTPVDTFPYSAIREMGYPFIECIGEPGYNGVAIISRVPLHQARIIDITVPSQARHLYVQLGQGIHLHNVYVPAGGDVPDVALNPKFDHKLRFVRDLTAYMHHTYQANDPVVLVGDLNIAPLPSDVWSHKQLLSVVSHTPIEVEHLDALAASRQWVDPIRLHTPPPTKVYTWWSYRNRDWKKSNRGRRLDHIWVSPALSDTVHSTHILQEARDWPSPSDHVPVIAQLDLPIKID